MNQLQDLARKHGGDTDALKNRQSTRTTFKLSEEALEAKEWLARYWGGITQKEAVDIISDSLDELPEELWSIAESSKEDQLVRRTHVISQRARNLLEAKADEEGISRDDVLERSLLFYRESVEPRLEKHREALELIEKFLQQARKTERKLLGLLGHDDPICKRFGIPVTVTIQLIGDIQDELDDGTAIDPNGM